MEHSFPIYRRYSNNKSWFKVLADDAFEEIQVMGPYYSIHHFQAKILPDRNFIADMIALEGNSWEEVTEADYQGFLKKCMQEFKKAE